MDNMRLQDEILAKLIGILDKPVMQMVEAAVSVVLRNYDVTRKETALSTTVVEFPELDIFLARMRYRNCSSATIRQYRATLVSFLAYVNKPVAEITDGDIRSYLDDYERARQVKKRTKDGKRRIISSFFTYLLNNGHLPHGNPMVRVEAIEYTKTVRQALTAREVEKLRIAADLMPVIAYPGDILATGCPCQRGGQYANPGYRHQGGVHPSAWKR